MVETSRRTPVRGPTFIRLVAGLTDREVAHPDAPPSERLSQWIDWTRAVALSRALDGDAPATTSSSDAATPELDDRQACALARHTLAVAISGDSLLSATPGCDNAATDAPEFATYRKRYETHQRAMQAATGRLRGRLRDRLSADSAEHARLADVDALMEAVLSPREQTLLASVPGFLGEHFERLRGAAESTGDATLFPSASPGAAHAWLDVFHRDMRNVLMAELDIRFHPIEALLAALRHH